VRKPKAAEPEVEEEVVAPEPEPAPEPEHQPEPAPEPEPEQVTQLQGGMVYFLPTSNTMGTTTESGASFALAAGTPVKMTAADAAALVAEGLGSIKGD
jgi:fused signal recognition particle receptor